MEQLKSVFCVFWQKILEFHLNGSETPVSKKLGAVIFFSDFNSSLVSRKWFHSQIWNSRIYWRMTRADRRGCRYVLKFALVSRLEPRMWKGFLRNSRALGQPNTGFWLAADSIKNDSILIRCRHFSWSAIAMFQVKIYFGKLEEKG